METSRTNHASDWIDMYFNSPHNKTMERMITSKLHGIMEAKPKIENAHIDEEALVDILRKDMLLCLLV